MKKLFRFAILAIVAAASFTGCKPKETEKEDPTTSVEIKLSDHELKMAVDDTYRLKTTITPSGTELALTWKSTNDAVASVNASGLVSAVAEGDAQIIVSANGATGDTCYVTVTDEAKYDIFNIEGYGLFGDYTEIPNTDTILKIRVGPVNVRLNTITLLAWDGDLNFVSGSGWSGAGLLTEGEVPVYLIVDGDSTKAYAPNYVGYYVGWGGFGVTDLEAAGVKNEPYYAQAGKIDVENYGKFIESLIKSESEDDIDMDAYNSMIKGTYSYYVDADNDAWYSYYPYGVVNRMLIIENEDDSFDFGADITWSNVTAEDRYFGLKVTHDDEGKLSGVVKPYDYATVGPMHFGTLSFDDNSGSNEAPRYNLGSMNKVHKEMPSFVKEIRADRMYRK